MEGARERRMQCGASDKYVEWGEVPQGRRNTGMWSAFKTGKGERVWASTQRAVASRNELQCVVHRTADNKDNNTWWCML